tara:strand:+ start:3947 stop:4096 length:150 start_codon:yes stop_codon:yes gene_type:complete
MNGTGATGKLSYKRNESIVKKGGIGFTCVSTAWLKLVWLNPMKPKEGLG